MQRIFISSVQKELAEERRALKAFIEGDALLRRFFEVFLFEDLPASDRRVDEVYLREVDRCALYIGLFGHEYGVEDAEGLSPTEREFDRATGKGKSRLVFVKGSDDKGRHFRMLALIRKAGSQLIRRRFLGEADLTAAVYAALVEHLEQTGGLRTKPFDAAACPDAKMSDLSREKVTEFLTRAHAERGYALGPKTSTPKALAHLNLCDGEYPSHAAMLLFGKNPQRFLLTSEVKCMHFHGLEVRKPIPSYHIYKGTVFELVDQAFDFVMSKIDRAVIPRDGKVTSDVEYELPWKAVREAIVNAVTHRDYASNASVQVMLFADRLEVWNPGALPPPLTIQKLRKPHASIPHNPLIADPMFLATYAEKAGSGILDMLSLCRLAGLRRPAFRHDGGQFVQTIWRPKRAEISETTAEVGTQSRPSRDQAEAGHILLPPGALEAIQVELEKATAQVTAQVAAQVMQFCREPRGAREIMAILDLKHWKTFQTNYLKPLLNIGLIEMTIPDRPRSSKQKYRLTDKGRSLLNDDKQ